MLWTLLLSSAICALDGMAVTVAIPAMMLDLGAGLDDLLWVVNAYVLALVMLLVIGGRLADLYGPRTLFLIGLAVFTSASGLAGTAGGAGTLIAARVLQGVGAALLLPQTMSMVTHIFPPERRGRAFGLWGVVAGIVVALGPAVGGLIVSSLGWRWIFYVNLPLGGLGLVAVALVCPNPRAERRRRFDLLGSALLALALFAVAFALIEGRAAAAVAAAVPLAAFVLVERTRRHRDPLLPLALVKDRGFTLMTVVNLALPASVGSMMFLTVYHLQNAGGLPAAGAGLVVAAAPAVSVPFAALSGRLTDRYGGKYVLFAGLLLFLAGLAWAAVTIGGPWPDLLPGLLVFGAGMGLVYAPPGTIAMYRVPPVMSGAASGVFSTVTRIGALIGSAGAGALLRSADDLTHAVSGAYVLPLAVSAAAAMLTLAVEPMPRGRATGRAARSKTGSRAEPPASSVK
ncbi:MFS transporter [Nonomuraea sp. NN258]|uniref:MFS transporter n=1 Tax=Nonomuraea antri TaxID=2730852 RepID=UPI0015693407|nr:MFS transporter [Nonomuraea antri]NRQ31830.1 MFS transporter [Nonomuraea antri]